MPMPATAKGPVVVLGLPFLRAYSTVFDAENHQLGFLKSARAESIAHAVRQGLSEADSSPQRERLPRRLKI